MAPSTVYTRASTSLVSSSNPSVLRSLTSSCIRRQQPVPVRSLWWWSRHGTWSSANDENLEERIQRHHKIMRHRYSRALRRRAMWERDDNVSSWLCRTPHGRFDRRWGMCRTMSSTDPNRSRLDEKQDGFPGQQEFWTKTKKDFEKFDQDFEAFKAAVDRAVETDPYGAVFGRRLHSPTSHNNSSWISWLFNRGDATQEEIRQPVNLSSKRKIEIEVINKKDPPIKSTHPKVLGVKRSAPAQPQPITKEDYVYDPISGRNVPRSAKEMEQPEQPKHGLLETLFSEHGTEPDKPIKQHRVYGHDPQAPNEIKVSENAKPEQDFGSKKNFESSRRREYQQLRASTLGNSIDTTSEFGGKYKAEPVAEHEVVDKKVRIVPEPKEDVPLFSGTAYESRSNNSSQSPAAQVASWLEREGFQTLNSPGNDIAQPSPTPRSRLEPSFDRMQTDSEASQERKFISKLQPAIDRIQLSKPKDLVESAPKQLKVISSADRKAESTAVTSLQPELSRSQDIDLLRASDVRAATKIARTTKQEAAQAKVEERSQLEHSFDQIQKRQPEEFISDAETLRADAGRLSRNIDWVRKHAERHPHGFVAQAMKSIGMPYKKYEKPYSANSVDLTDRLDFPEDSLKRLPSIYRNDTQKPLSQPIEVSQAVKDEEKARADLTESLRSSSRQADAIKKKNNTQIEQLANSIHQIYEAEQGPIDLSLNHDLIQKVETGKSALIQISEPKMSMQTSSDFFAAREQFLKEVNQVTKDVKSVKAKTTRLEAAAKDNSITESEVSDSVQNLTAEAKSHLEKVESLHQEFDRQQKAPHPLFTATTKPGVTRHPEIEWHTQVFEPQLIHLREQTKSITKRHQDISTVLEDLKKGRAEMKTPNQTPEQIQKQELQSKHQAEDNTIAKNQILASPYLILVYNKTTGKVNQTAMERLPWSPTEKVEKANPVKIMGNLNYPAAFVTHFVELEKSGYELSSGGGDMLIFQKIQTPTEPEVKVATPVAPAPKILRNMIAAEEASLQPEITETIAQPKDNASNQAATVLDEVPVEIPHPGPAAPTAPPSTNSSKRTSRTGSKVRRQEHVFSGTIPIRPAPTRRHSLTKENESANNNDNAHSGEPNDTFFARTTRTARRGLLGVAVFGAAAYTIGVVAEGIGAQAQIEGDAVTGPRRKVVMPVGQRPGIYSTESSRTE